MTPRNALVAAVAALVLASALGCGRVSRLVKNTGCRSPSIDVSTKIPNKPGQYTRKVVVNGVDRRMIIDIPEGYTGNRPVPLVVVFHGASPGAESFKRSRERDLLPELRKRGWITVFPDGIAPIVGPNIHTWNALGPDCCGLAYRCEVDDLGFTKKMLDTLDTQLAVDKKRVYAVGFSNGGMFVHALMSSLGKRFSAAVSLSSMAGSKPKKSGTKKMVRSSVPVPMLMLHGMRDPVIPYTGGLSEEGLSTVAFSDTVAHWTKNNGCRSDPKETVRGPTTIRSFGGCEADVVAISVEPLAHAWPIAEKTGGFDGTRAVVDWLAKH